MNEFEENEPLLEGRLAQDALRVPPPSERLREELLSRTSKTVRSRARVRRLARTGAMVLAYGLGALTVLLWPDNEPAPVNVAHVEPPAPAAQPAMPPAPSTPTELTEDVLSDPERFALYLHQAAPDKQREALKLAGDRYLNEQGDVKQALACYRQAVALATPEDLQEFDITDTWLLRSLKQDRLQEISHEKGDA